MGKRLNLRKNRGKEREREGGLSVVVSTFSHFVKLAKR
jgi:hypothetical protein